MARPSKGPSVEQTLSNLVLSGQYEEELSCIIRSFDVKDEDVVNSSGFDVAMAIRMPWVLTQAIQASKIFIAPLNCAVHQILRACEQNSVK